MQSAGVQVAVRHFIAIEQEIRRSPVISVNETIIKAISSNVNGKVSFILLPTGRYSHGA